MGDISDLKRLIHWGDLSARDRLLIKGGLTRVPKHAICDPGNCFWCDIEDIGVFKAIWYYMRSKVKRG